MTVRRPTMRDVAARAEVSFKTVSRVVNEEGGVSPQLESRVRKAIDELDFRPNAGARNLRRSDNRTAAIGLLLEDVANPFSAAVQRAVEDEAVPRGVVVFSASLDEDPARERALAREFSARHADGLLLAPAGDDQSHLAAELRAGTAIVCVDRAATNLPVDSVVATNTIGAGEGVRHLLASGHRRIAYLGDRSTIATARERFAGYEQALEASGLVVDPRLVVHDIRDAGTADGVVTSLMAGADPPTAFFTAQNMITIGAFRALRRLGLEHAVALVGFDDFLLADLLSPGITVVAQDPVAIGRLAAELLFDRIAGASGPPQTRLVPTTLVRRGSGELPPH
ncbi:LacI family DNA-binding transcriptional regulator [Pseudonocardia sp. TRM90224]|uniref:LacI family DNA-binding transcriptional regulator n=1 Tax=Pseudonocardia sp. TRM90224 TaxID=2812678 RepID=UPI001E4F9A54|nr:LacI family DNA-binding transcriptional regulator [Pseudonocardia sp. TRM90224]